MFRIKLQDPIGIGYKQEDDTNLRAAIESTFPEITDYVFIEWNGVEIALSCKYDLSIILEDIIIIVREAKDMECKYSKVNWPSSTFMATWKLYFNKEKVKISAIWLEVDVSDLGYDQLVEKNIIEVDRSEFIFQWTLLLNFINENLKKAGFQPEDLEDYQSLLDEL